MTTVNANVTAGHSFTPPVLVTADDLNELGVPAVSVDLAAKVALADLAAATANYLVTGTATVGDEDVSHNVDVTIQFTNSSGTNMAVVVPSFWWWAASSGAAPSTLHAITPAIVGSDGTIIINMTDSNYGLYLSSAAGKLVLRFNYAAGTLASHYIQGFVGSKYITGSKALSWA